MKKPPSKVAHNRPNFFFSTGPAAQKAQNQKSRTIKSPLMQDWVFRLGFGVLILGRALQAISLSLIRPSSNLLYFCPMGVIFVRTLCIICCVTMILFVQP